MTAWSPTGRSLPCPVKENGGVHTATFQPDETGEWSIAITHKGTHIQGGPFICFVFDPNGIKLVDTDGAMPGQPFSFIVDATETGGLGDVNIDIVHDKQSVPFRMEDIGHMKYRVSMLPRDAGKYRVYLYFNGADVRGSPISIRVGTHKSRRSKDTSGIERTGISSMEKRMNGLNVTDHNGTNQQKRHQSSVYKNSQSPTQSYRDYSHHQSAYKNSNYTNENSSSAYHVPSPLNTRSPVQNSSPSLIKESREIYSTTYNRSRSPNIPQSSPGLIKESKDIYASSSLSRSRSPNTNNNIRNSQSTTTIKESKDIYQSSNFNSSRSPPVISPGGFRNSNDSPINRSFSPKVNDKEFGRRKESVDNGVVDTSSNVRGKSIIKFVISDDSSLEINV